MNEIKRIENEILRLKVRLCELAVDAPNESLTKKQATQIESSKMIRLLEAFQKIDAGYHLAISTLSNANLNESCLYRDLCNMRQEVERVQAELNPTVFL